MGEGITPFGISETKRLVVPAAERLLYREHDVNGGIVELVDYMGGDEMAERVATAGHGSSIFPEKPSLEEFISYLTRHGIVKPFHYIQLKLHIQSPIEAALFLVYLEEANINEYSGRYSRMLASGEVPSVERIAEMIGDTSAEGWERSKKMYAAIALTREQTVKDYSSMLDADFARELARSGLGINNDTKFFFKIDLPPLARAYMQQKRFHDAHSTTLPYLEQIASIAAAVAPLSWNALTADPDSSLALTLPHDRDVVDGPLQAASWKPQPTRRITVQGIEDLLFSEKPLLDHGGLQAIDYMGDDYSLAQAARVSYGKDTKQLSDDITLVKSLVRDEHTSPVEMAEFSVEDRLPVFDDPRQAGRHRTLPRHGFMGYTPLGELFYLPDESQIKYQDRVNRQGRGKEMEPEEKQEMIRLLTRSRDLELDLSHRLESLGASEELIRKSKGVGFYTRNTRTGDALNWARFFKLRSDAHAQYEVRMYSEAVEEIYKAQLPQTYAALKTYMLDSMKLSTKEVNALVPLLRFKDIFPNASDLEQHLLTDLAFSMKNKQDPERRELNREGQAFIGKLKRLYGAH